MSTNSVNDTKIKNGGNSMKNKIKKFVKKYGVTTEIDVWFVTPRSVNGNKLGKFGDLNGNVSLEPKEWMYFNSYSNCYGRTETQTGCSYVDDDNNRVYYKASYSSKPFAFLNYHEDFPEILQVVLAELDCSRIKPGVERKFDTTVCYIDTKKNLYDSEGRKVSAIYYGSGYWKEILDIYHVITKYANSKNSFTKVNTNNFVKFIGIDKLCTNGGTLLDLSNPYDICTYYKNKQVYNKFDAVIEIDEILSLELPDYSKYLKKFKPIIYTSTNYWGSTIEERLDNFSIVQKVNDNFAVIRTFKLEDEQKFIEHFRVYIPRQKSKPIKLYKFESNIWHKCSNIDTYSMRNIIKSILVNKEEMSVSTRLKYLQDCIFVPEDKKEGIRENYYKWIKVLISMLRHPELEKVNKLISNTKFTNILDLQHFFLISDNKLLKSNPLKAMGVTSSQLKLWDEKAKQNSNTKRIRCVNELLSTSTLTNIDINSFEMYLDMIPYIGNSYISNWHREFNVSALFNRSLPMANKERQITLLKRIYRLNNKFDNDQHLLSVFYDGLSNYGRLHAPDPEYFEVNVYSFDCISDITRFHDLAVEAVATRDQRREEEQAAERQERDKKLKKIMDKTNKERQFLEYENDEYLIRLPKTPGEISSEGTSLHHCVGGYASDHSKGITTIMFLRNKKEESKSFYTIEIDIPNHKIIQIHGLHNRWLGNNPEAIPFVKQWLEKFKISCSDRILRSTATGYSDNGATLVELPE